MRNLKKVLSLTLALVMMLGMMTFAGAAETKLTAADFKDMDKVVNKEAVTLLVDLGVLNGIKAADGTYTFNPAGNIERGAYAKMVYAVKLATDKADVYKGANTGLTDVKGHWAEGYIAYCVSTKIAAGNPNKTFTPNANISVVAAAKMLLTALGYDATLSKYENDPLWAINIMADAQSAGLMNGVNLGADAVLTRDAAAQMIYNALFAEQVRPVIDRDQGIAYLVKYENKYTAVAPAVANNKLGEFVFGLKEETGIVLGTKAVPFASTKTLKDGQTSVAKYVDGVCTITTDFVFDGATDVSLLGHQVKWFTNSKGEIISTALVETGKTKTYTANEKYDKLLSDNGLTALKTVFSASYAAGKTVADKTADIKGVTPGTDVLLINTDGDKANTVEFAITTAYEFDQVKSVDAGKGSIRLVGNGTINMKNVSGADGLVKGDFVIYSKAADVTVLAKAPSVEGIVAAKKGTSGAYKIDIGGTTYKVSATELSGMVNDNEQPAESYVSGLTVSKAVTGTFFLNKAGEVAAYKGETAAETAKYAVVTNIKASKDAWDPAKVTVEAKVILADGTRTTLNLADKTADTVGDTLYDLMCAAMAKDNGSTPTTYDAAIAAITNAGAGQIYAYTLNADGKMIALYQGGVGEAKGVTEIATTGKAGVTGFTCSKLAFHATKTNMSIASVGATDGNSATGFTSGKPTFDTNKYVDEKTNFVYYTAATSTAAESIKSFTGMSKAPNFGKVAIDYVYGTDFAEFVFVRSAPAADRTNAAYAYYLGGAATENANGYAYEFVVNGKLTNLTLAAAADVTVDTKALYTYVTDDKGVSELVAVADIDGQLAYVAIAEKAVVTAVGANYVILDNTTVVFTDDCTVDNLTLFNADGDLTPATASLSKDDTVMCVYRIVGTEKYMEKAYIVANNIDTETALGAYKMTVAIDWNADETAAVATPKLGAGNLTLPNNYEYKYVWSTNDEAGDKKTAVVATTGNSVLKTLLTDTKTYTVVVTIVDKATGGQCSTTGSGNTGDSATITATYAASAGTLVNS